MQIEPEKPEDFFQKKPKQVMRLRHRQDEATHAVLVKGAFYTRAVKVLLEPEVPWRKSPGEQQAVGEKEQNWRLALRLDLMLQLMDEAPFRQSFELTLVEMNSFDLGLAPDQLELLTRSSDNGENSSSARNQRPLEANDGRHGIAPVLINASISE